DSVLPGCGPPRLSRLVTAAVSGRVGLPARRVSRPRSGRRPAERGAALAGTSLTLSVVIILLAAFLVLTRWGPVDLEHLRARRAFPQLIRAARQLYGRHWRPMVLIALTAIAIVGG